MISTSLISIISSISIILMALGGLGLVYTVFASGALDEPQLPPPQDIGFLTYENPDYNIQIEYPAN